MKPSFPALVLSVVAGFIAPVAHALEWKTQQLSIKAAPLQRTAEATFEFTNTGPKTVTITSVDTSCDCLEAKPSAKTFAPGASGTIDAHFSFSGSYGTLHRMIIVSTDDGQSPATLSVELRIPEIAQLTPRSLEWELGGPGGEQTVEIEAVAGVELTIYDVQPTSDAFIHRLEVVRARQGYRLYISPKDPTKPANAAFRLLANTGTGEQLIFSAYANVRRAAPTSPEEHALAFAAYLDLANEQPPGELHEHDSDPGYRKSVQELLAGSWDVHDKAELLSTLEWLSTEGHRKEYVGVRDAMLQIPEPFLPVAILRGYTTPQRATGPLLSPPKDMKEVERRMLILLHLHDQPGQAPPIAAWDLGRYISMCKWGYHAGYFSRQEAIDLILPMARRIQKSYDSWGEYSQAYVLGRTYWAPENMREAAESYSHFTHRLLNNYWRKISWASPLGNGPVAPAPEWESGQPR